MSNAFQKKDGVAVLFFDKLIRFVLKMNSVFKISRCIFLCVSCIQLAYPQTEQEVWKCGNLLTNQPELKSPLSERAKCKLLDTPRGSVTVVGGSQHLPTLLPNTAPKTALNSVASYAGGEQSSRDQMGKIILLNERARITARQTLLEGRLKGLAITPGERQEIESEMNRNTADLNGLKREIAKLP